MEEVDNYDGPEAALNLINLFLSFIFDPAERLVENPVLFVDQYVWYSLCYLRRRFCLNEGNDCWNVSF